MKLPCLFFCLALLLASCTPWEILSEETGESITIAYAEPISSYSPLSYEAKNRKYLTNIYESLVRYDPTFNYETGLAVSWGRLDDTTWDFKLRQDVTFHDGSTFDADDVLYSLQLAREYEGSELSSLLSTIVSVEKTEDYRVKIVTSRPDPLLLNKLTYVYMVPNGYENFDIPVGTGPYRTSQFVDDTLVLERFDDYWGPVAYFKEARLKYISDPEERLNAMLDGEVDVLANVPPQNVADLETAGLKVESSPSLEISFLMLNRNGPFADSNLRAAVWNALSTDYVDQFGGGYLMETSQFAATGITGYDPELELRTKDLDAAKSARALLADEVNLTLDIPQGLEVLGQAIQEDLAKIEITVTVNAIKSSDYEDVVMAGFSDFYFFGWKYDLADSEDFFTSILHTPTETYGEFNAFGYSNPEIDTKIEEASTVFDPTQRRLLLSELSSQLLAEQTVIPLFESQVLYALSPDLYYDFRLDGQIWASEIVENVVK
ncbi:MAG: ABC transporter substrate-binding protein [Candidatus Gracilibacteria bacterium]